MPSRGSESLTVALSHWPPHLPLFLTKQNKIPVGILVFFMAAFLYLTSNWYHLFLPQFLPITWVDQNTPFMPWTVWIYISEYPFFLAIYLFAREMSNLNKYLYAFFAMQTVSVIIFWLWPTTFPRDSFPLPVDLDPTTYFIFDALRNVDTPANCCPSLHVSSVFLSSFIYLNEKGWRLKFPFFFIWASAIAATTLTTKQHYLVDVVTGFLLAAIVYVIFYKLIYYWDYYRNNRVQAGGTQANR